MRSINSSGRARPRRQQSRRINRAASPARALIVPYASIILASLLPAFLLADVMPILPPLGFVMLIGWRIMRPSFLPLWAGAPLGMFDDLFSGQPFGSAMLLWSLTLIALEAIETRFPWRGFWQDWFTASLAIVLYCGAAMMFSGAPFTSHQAIASLPQLMAAVLVYPFFARFIAGLDQFRLARARRIR